MSRGNGNTGGKTGKRGQFTKGHDPRRGVGKKGRSGRKPAIWKDFCRLAIHDPKVQSEIIRRLRSRLTKEYPTLLKAIAVYAVGEPPKRVHHTGLLSFASRLEGMSLAELEKLERATAEELLELIEFEPGEGPDDLEHDVLGQR